MILYFKVNN